MRVPIMPHRARRSLRTDQQSAVDDALRGTMLFVAIGLIRATAAGTAPLESVPWVWAVGRLTFRQPDAPHRA